MPSVATTLSAHAPRVVAFAAAADQPTEAVATQLRGPSDEPGAHQVAAILTPGAVIPLLARAGGNASPPRIRVGTAQVIPVDPTMSEIPINIETPDTAQTYVPAKAGGSWINLGPLIRCGTGFVRHGIRLPKQRQPRTLTATPVSSEVSQALNAGFVARR